jgi:prevent-host-death family protein
MNAVDVFEAENHFGQLLDAPERGEESLITRHGKPVARLVPAEPRIDRGETRLALARIRDRAERAKLGASDREEWKAYRDEGRP